ncbi:hypothetical protein [Methanorbis rubei]|uniref:Uncharacterized protein n=1 Tax=Methanorbis rubei TaxID=3028300 RepID=A0AAE4MFN3_9EURY|nr:hypothetical protein [Methanocorpusculaceae archaeon Cs1]
MTEYELNTRFDEVAEVDKTYVIASHTTADLVGNDGEPYTAVIGITPEGKRILFSGKAVVDGFSRLLEKIGSAMPYAVPKEFTLGELTAKNGRNYKIITHCCDVTL